MARNAKLRDLEKCFGQDVLFVWPGPAFLHSRFHGSFSGAMGGLSLFQPKISPKSVLKVLMGDGSPQKTPPVAVH